MIEKFNITKGPWWASNGEIGTVPMMMVKIARVYGTRRENDESRDNARAMAAVPELLERDILFMELISKIEDRSAAGEDPAYLLEELIDGFDFTPDRKALGMDWMEVKELL